jgi:hypothetical protein
MHNLQNISQSVLNDRLRKNYLLLNSKSVVGKPEVINLLLRHRQALTAEQHRRIDEMKAAILGK